MKRLDKRVVRLENINKPEYACNKCNYGDNEPISWNPFDFKPICDPLPCFDDDECPALDLIVNHYPDIELVIESTNQGNANNQSTQDNSSCIERVKVNAADDDNDDDDDDDDDLFEIVQVFDFPSK